MATIGVRPGDVLATHEVVNQPPALEGRNLFTEPNHDAGVVEELLGPVPLAGAFCAGEIGPVGGRNFLHSFTASVAVFER